MNNFVDSYNIRIDLVYANPNHPENIFGVPVYKTEARFFLYEKLANVVLKGAALAQSRYGWRYVLKDGLRTVEAQTRMLESPIVKANPHWLTEPRLLSPPGQGGHPRAMAVDITLEDYLGQTVDMGTVFDHLSTKPGENPARRDYEGISSQAKKNRKLFEQTMMDAAVLEKTEILPIPQEWWDYRLPQPVYEAFKPISDSDLPFEMRMT